MTLDDSFFTLSFLHFSLYLHISAFFYSGKSSFLVPAGAHGHLCQCLLTVLVYPVNWPHLEFHSLNHAQKHELIRLVRVSK